MNDSDPSTIVIARPDRIGDVVLSSSCLAAVRARYPGAQVHWLVDERLGPLFHQHPAINGLLPAGAGSFWQRVRELTAAFRKLRPDALALLQPDRAIELAAWRAGIPMRAGFARPRSWPQFLTHATPYEKSEGTQHEAAMNFSVLNLLGVSAPERIEPWLTPDPAARDRLRARLGSRADILRRAAVFHLAAHGDKLRAPLPLLTELAGWLHRAHGLGIILLGLETDPSLAEFAGRAGLAPGSLLDLRGSTDLGEAAAVLQDAALCVARDSGPAHLAAALRCPTLTLFVDLRPIAGPTRWTPLGPHVVTVAISDSGFRLGDLQGAAIRLLAGAPPRD